MKIQISILVFLGLFTTAMARAQAEIKGPSCVVAGVEYDYFIDGNADSIGEISVCIRGGSFTDTKQACKTVKPLSSIRINWDENANNASLSFTYSFGNGSLKINVTTPLTPGDINASTRKQMLKYDSSFAVINCSPASGGSCFPKYSYQWQQSANALKWIDIRGANGINLSSQGRLKEPVFYRRKVVELVSGSVAYSTMATTFVEADYKSR